VEPEPTISYHPTLGGENTPRWPLSLTIARGSGFAAMDIVLTEIANEPSDATREALDRADVRAGPASLPVEYRRDDATFSREFSRLPELARLAAQIGVETMHRSIPASGEVPARELGPVLRRRLVACANVLEEHGIKLAIEPLGPRHRRREGSHESIWRLPDAAEFAASCHSGIGVLVDSWHWHHASGTVQDIIDVAPLIHHVHIADAPDLPPEAIRDEERLLPGAGVVDLTSFAAALRRVRYTGFVSPEVRGYRCSGPSTDCARAALYASRAPFITSA